MHPSGSLVWRFSWLSGYFEVPFFLPALALCRQPKCVTVCVLSKGQNVKHRLHLCSELAGVVCSCSDVVVYGCSVMVCPPNSTLGQAVKGVLLQVWVEQHVTASVWRHLFSPGFRFLSQSGRALPKHCI